MNKRLFVFTSLVLAVALLLTACANPAADRYGQWWEVNRWWDTPLGVTLTQRCVNGATAVTLGGITYPCHAPAAPPATTTEAAPAPAAPAFTQQWEVPDGRWTPALTENLVVEMAIQVRPTKPWEGTVGPVENQVYQFKTEYLDEDATTWQPGVHLYEFDLAAGWQPVFVGIQGDSPVQLCWMQEEGAQGAQLLMKTMKGNGTSALVYFTKTDKVPAAVCP